MDWQVNVDIPALAEVSGLPRIDATSNPPARQRPPAMSSLAADTSDRLPAVRTDAAWLDAHWMPFTANRQFKADPRLIVEAQGLYFTDSDGRKIFDGLSGLWCSGLGHGRPEITEAVSRQIARLD
jgi:beta-alanine--pyruvate transaminase